MFDDEEYANVYKARGWVRSTCIMNNWLPDTSISHKPVYTVTINDNVVIEGYIYDGEIVPLAKAKDKEINTSDVIKDKEEKPNLYIQTCL